MPSKSEVETIQCPHCGHVQPFTRWVKIMADEDPRLKHLLLNDELMSCTCFSCKHTLAIRGDLRYWDSPRQLYIYLRPGAPFKPDPGFEQMLDMLKQEISHVYAVDTDDELKELIRKYDRLGKEEYMIDVPVDKIRINEQMLERFRTASSDQGRGDFSITDETVENILVHSQPLLGKQIKFQQEELQSWPANDIPHVIAMQLAICLLDKKSTENEFLNLMGYLEFINSESQVILSERLGPQIYLRQNTSATPPIYAYKDGAWGWEIFLKHLGAVPDTDKHDMLVLANYDRVSKAVTITPDFLAAGTAGEVVMDMMRAGNEGKTTLPKYLAVIDAAMASDRSRTKPARAASSAFSLPSSSGSGCMLTILLWIIGFSATTLAINLH